MRVCWLLLLTGCWLSDTEITDRYEGSVIDPDTDVPGVVTTEVTAVSPRFGTAAGGTEVTLTVDAVGDDVVVTFDGEPATIVRSTATTIVVTTPAGAPGATPITVRSGDDEITAPDDFWYWEDGAGRFGAVGWLDYTEYTGDLAMLGYVDEVSAVIQFVEPTDDGTAELWSSELDQCTALTTVPDHASIDLHAADLQLQHGSDMPISIPYSPEDTAYIAELEMDDWTGDASYDLLQPQGSAPFPYFAVPDFLQTPSPFRVTEPSFAYDRLFSERFGADVSQEFDLRWGVSATGDYAVVTVIRWGLNNAGTQYQVKERVRCHLVDDGVFTFTPSTWSGWDLGAPMDIYVSRMREPDGVLPHTGATNDVAGRYTVAGTVWQALIGTP